MPFTGFFECEDCDKTWRSVRIFRTGDRKHYQAQKCRSCEELCQPHKVLDRKYWGRMFGHFKCNNCKSAWGSAHVYRKDLLDYYWQECKSCNNGQFIQPLRVHMLHHSRGGSSKSKEPQHRSDLCEKCQSSNSCT